MLPVQAPRSNDDFWFVPLGRWCRRGGAWFKRGVSCHSLCESICCLLVVTSRSMSVFRDSIEGCGLICLFFCWKSEFAEICWIWVNVQPRVWRGLTSKGSYMGAIMEWSKDCLSVALRTDTQRRERCQPTLSLALARIYIRREETEDISRHYGVK